MNKKQLIATKKRSIWRNLGLALASTPMIAVIGLILITLIGILDDAVTKIQSLGYWWVIFIVAYILSFIYFSWEPIIRINRERKKIVNALLLYLKEQLARQNKPQLSNDELVREILLERVKIWAWFDPDLWIKYFPDEKYPVFLFDIVNNLINSLEKMERSNEKIK